MSGRGRSITDAVLRHSLPLVGVARALVQRLLIAPFVVLLSLLRTLAMSKAARALAASKPVRVLARVLKPLRPSAVRVTRLVASIPLPMWAYLLVLFVHMLPRVVLGGNSIITIHDGLDSDFLYRVLMTKPGRVLNYDTIIPEILNGVPRVAFPTGLGISGLLFSLFRPFNAYCVLEQVVHGVGFWSMYLLLSDHLQGKLPRGLRVLLSFTYACYPFYIVHEASISGQPAVAWALLHLLKATGGRKRIAAFAVLAAFPFMSVLPTAGAFVVLVAGIATTFVCLAQRRLHLDVWLGLVVLVAFYFIVNWPFVQVILTHSYPTHRETWVRQETWEQYFKWSWVVFWQGHVHAVNVPTVCMATMTITGLIALVRRQFDVTRQMLAFVIVCAALTYVSYLPHTPLIKPLQQWWPRIDTINVRTFWCLAPICLFGFAVALNVWWSRWRWGKLPAILLAVFQLYWALDRPPKTQAELFKNYDELVRHWRRLPSKEVTYNDFMAKPVYAAVKRHIGRPRDSYRILSVGLDPARGAYNGFWSADGYHNSYPLAYKARFRRVMEANLAIDEFARTKFDNIGSYALTFIPGTRNKGHRATKNAVLPPITNFTLSRRALNELGVEYVLASAPLADPRITRVLDFDRSFQDPRVPLTIYLYKVKPWAPRQSPKN